MRRTSGPSPKLWFFHLKWKVKRTSSLHIFSDGCDKLYTKLSAESEANGGSFPDNAMHQMYTFLRFIAIGTEKAIKGSNKINEQVNISPNRR